MATMNLRDMGESSIVSWIARLAASRASLTCAVSRGSSLATEIVRNPAHAAASTLQAMTVIVLSLCHDAVMFQRHVELLEP
jgi:hypothetical protein